MFFFLFFVITRRECTTCLKCIHERVHTFPSRCGSFKALGRSLNGDTRRRLFEKMNFVFFKKRPSQFTKELFFLGCSKGRRFYFGLVQDGWRTRNGLVSFLSGGRVSFIYPFLRHGDGWGTIVLKTHFLHRGTHGITYTYQGQQQSYIRFFISVGNKQKTKQNNGGFFLELLKDFFVSFIKDSVTTF